MRCISGNTLVQLPREVLGRIFLQLESPAPARFLGVCRTINAALGGDAHLLATWLQYPVDDRRLLLNATESGNRNVIVDVLTRAALILDARVLADAFIRAWDNADPHLLCLPRIGILWPRCSASRWFILEKLVQEEDEVVRVFSLQLPPNNGAGVLPIPPPGDVGIDLADEIVDTVMHSMRVCFALIEDEVKSTLARRRSSTKQSFAMKEKQEKFGGFKGLTVSRNCDTLLAAGVLHEVVGIARLDDEEHRNDDQGWEEQEKDKDYDIANINQRRISHILSVELISQKVFKRRKCIYTDIWEPSIPFVQRAFDAFVAFGSVRMVALMLYSHGQQIRVKPYHLTAALDRFSLPLVYFLIQYAGANPTWPEDVSLFGYIRRPTDPSLFGGPVPSIASLDASGRACWVWALRQGVNITERQWIAIVKLGPATVSAVVEHYGAAVFDPCRDDMAGFKHGSANVVRILSHVIDGRYSGSSKCVLWEAAYGDGVALTYLIRLGEILAHDLKRGDRERVMELLDAGAIILDQVLLVAAGISDRAPGEWDEWPLAARCYRRVLVQRRMGLPIPSMDTLQRLPETVVTTTFLAALFSTRPIYCNPLAANIYSLYQRRRHPNAAGVRINLVPVLEREVAVRVVETAMDNLRELLKMCDDPAYPGEAYCFIKGMLQFGLRDKNLLRDEDEFFLPDDEWEEVASALLGHK
ncbi:hypothetical protein HK100_010615 [Physocladia obscura]|uniref:F-box domain-containing protein n=1 Tax=Physocladia obscura TaxID=109957 RepID=A0AAD5XDR3_9FUNG|nr:hypothetical protein HK100_010615 [Physocladia obscura]